MLDEKNLQDISGAALQQGQLEPRNLIAGATRNKASYSGATRNEASQPGATGTKAS
jgi:hypothetical protein